MNAVKSASLLVLFTFQFCSLYWHQSIANEMRKKKCFKCEKAQTDEFFFSVGRQVRSERKVCSTSSTLCGFDS